MLNNDEILQLNTLMYLNDTSDENPLLTRVDNYFNHHKNDDLTVGDWINSIDTNKLIDDFDYGSGMTGRDWKNIIGSVKKDDTLMNLTIAEPHVDTESGGNGLSVLFLDKNNNEALFVFRGTEGEGEWKDNFTAGNVVDTPMQRNALEWYRKMYTKHDLKNYETITTTGHSKGGNKSKYITIVDDTVDRCISVDGQGFSDKFFKENSYQIAKNQGKIENHNIDNDFVNPLLSDIGKKTFYIGQDVADLSENHAPNSFFKYDKEGNYTIEVNPNGQSEEMQAVDRFVNGFIRSMNEEDRNRTLDMIGTIVATLRCDETIDKSNILTVIEQYGIKEHSKEMSYLIAYIIRYDQEHPEFMKQLGDYLDRFGLEDVGTFFIISGAVLNLEFDLPLDFLSDYNPFYNGSIGKKLHVDFDLLYGLLTDGVLPIPFLLKNDNIAKDKILKKLFELLSEKIGTTLTPEFLLEFIVLLKMVDIQLDLVKLNENGADIWIGPLIPKMTRTSLTSERSEVVHEQEDGYKCCYFWCDLSGMRVEADNLIRYSKKYEQIIAEVEGHANNLSFSSSATDAIRQSLLSVAARMRTEKEKLNELGKVLHTITNMYEATEDSVVANAQGRRSVSNNAAVGLPVKIQLT